MNKISLFIVPLMVLFIVIYGYKKKVNLYDSFVEGAKEGLHTVVTIFPFIIGMVFAVNIFLESNFIPYMLSFLQPFFNKINLPVSMLPMALLRSISGTATLVILNDTYINFGPDSFAGNLASTIQGSSDTTFYVLTLYFGSIGVKKMRYALSSGLFADLMGIIMAFIISYIMFY